MKKILLGLFFVMFAMQVNAATYNLYNTQADAVNDQSVILSGSAVGDGDKTSFNSTSGTFERFLTVTPSTNTFTLGGGSPDIATTLTKLMIEGVTNVFGYTSFDNSSYSVTGSTSGTDLTLVGLLQEGTVYKIALDWTKTAGVVGSVDINVGAVPVPAAVWLFGSALMGLVGVSRRKSTAVAA